ncbi:MAG TPA: S49 family peptidase [Polyangiaceae bacterium]
MTGLRRPLRLPRLLLAACLALSACTARERFGHETESESDAERAFEVSADGSDHVAVFDLSEGAPEQAPSGLFQLPLERTYPGLVQSLSKALDDDQTKGVFVRLSQQNYDWAQSQEIGRLLAEFKKKGKRVTCHGHSLTNSTAWLFLRGCERIWLSPAGEVTSVGIAAQMTYLKGALDKLRIQADFLHMGRYKSGGEPMTQEGPSDASRENLTATLHSIRNTWLAEAADARKQPALKHALEHGPYIPEAAKAKGIVDKVGFEADAIAEAKKHAGVEGSKVVFGPGRKQSDAGLAELVRLLAGTSDVDKNRPHIAVVPAVGGITMQSSESIGSSGITATAMLKTLRRLKKSESVKAVVLRLDSPGGSPLASDLIWREVMDLKKEKPVIASVGGMAASGGYYIACAADRIIAERTSIVGSIGVFGGKFVIGPALEEIGVTSYTFPASPEPGAAARAAYMSPLTPWDAETRSRVEDHMRHIYELFLARVAEGRRQPVDKVRKYAEGAIFSGNQGRDRGLVDDLGGLRMALEVARNRAGLPEDVSVVVEGLQDSLIESLFSEGEPAAGDAEAAALRRHATRQQFEALVPAELRSFVTSLLPLTQGERSVVALPFTMAVR